MSSWRLFGFRLRSLFRRRRDNAEMEAEMRHHLELRVERNRANGMTPEEARHAALRAFGGVEQIKERARDERRWVVLEQVAKDFRFAARSLRKAPGFTAAAVLILAIGIGANATLFSWIRPFLFDPLPAVADSDQIVAIENVAAAGNSTGEPLATSFIDFTNLRDWLKLVDVVGIGRGALAVGNDRGAESTWCELVSGNFFDVMGLRPAAGRFFSPSEQSDAQNAAPVAVISYDYWRARYRSDPAAIGSILRINQVAFTIIGVAPAGFQGTQSGLAYQIWLPLSMYGAITHTGTWMLQDRGTRNFTMLARLKPGATIDQARSEAASLARLMAQRNFEDRGLGIRILPLRQWHFGPQSTMLRPMEILMAACSVLLLIVCANVANLQLARTSTRRKEFSVRLAMGSSRERLARLLLIESLLLTLAAAALGLIMAQWFGGALHWLLPAVALPKYVLSTLAGGVLVYTLMLALVVAAVAGVTPALHAARSNLNEMLSQRGRGGSAGAHATRVRGLLVVAEVALAVVALVGAAAFLESFRDLRAANLGFSPENQVLTQFNLSTAGYTQAQADSFCQRLTERLRQVPGVTAVSYADTVPLGFSGGNWEQLEIEGYHPTPGENMKIGRNMIGPGYFDVMKIPLVDGRDFDLRDGPKSEPVMIVTEAFVQRFIPHGAVLGRKVHGWGRWFTIVGVVKDIKQQRVSEAAQPFFYIPIRQQYRPEYGLTFHVRTNGSMPALLAEIRRVAAEIDPALPVFDAEPMTEYIAGSLYGVKIAATLLSVLGGVGVLLAAMGLYSVTAFSVTQRKTEIGIRIALGAQAADLFAMVLRDGMRLTMVGLAAGGIAAAFLVRLASTSMTGLHPAAPLGYVWAVGFTLALAVLALTIPASRALRIDPIVALRNE